MFTSLFQLEQKPVTLFSSADTGAPVLTANPGSLKTLLKACLVTGYGSKQGLGWQMPFESADKNGGVFVSTDQTASKFYFKIDNAASDYAKLSAYQSMVDFTTGTSPIAVNNQYKLYSSNWRLIGHSKAFLLLIDAPQGGSTNKFAMPLFFGDLPREKKRVEPVCGMWNGWKKGYSGSLQAAIFANGGRGNATNDSNYLDQSPTYPFLVNYGSASENLGRAYVKFKQDTFAIATLLFEPILCQLSDSTWTFLPMLQPLSTVTNDVANLGLLSTNVLKAVTGDSYMNGTNGGYNNDCAVPTDWWYA